MTSVADIPDDANDDLSGISPELVLVDPELARLARERQPLPVTPALARGSTLRLVRASQRPEATEAPIVPRPSPSSGDVDVTPSVPDEPVLPTPTPERERESATGDMTFAASAAPPAPPSEVEPADEPVVPMEPKAPLVVDPEPEPVVPAPRVVEAEPARVLEPRRREIPAPLAEPVRPSRPETLQAPEPPISPAMEVAVPAMPHPVARPTSAAPTRRAPPTRRKGRRGLALLVAVAAASVAVIGFLQLTGGASDPARHAGRTAVGTPPSTKATHTSKSRTAAKTKTAAKPAAKPAPKPKATSKPSPPKTGPAAKSAQPGSSKTKASPPKQTQPRSAKATPTHKAAQPKPAPSQAPSVSSRTTPSPAPKPTTPAPATAPATRRFAWAPVPGATGYHVELFRGADRVLAQETKEPVLELGSSWRYEGKTVQLSPGIYRWYVWPVTKSGRATQAVVQAKLTIP